MDFRLRQLQCFLTLAKELNYGKTARVCYVSQPTLTFQIKGLEDSLGVQLFERNRQQVKLTEAGVIFRDYAQSIVDSSDQAREKLLSLKVSERLNIACGPIGQGVLLPSIYRELAVMHPSFDLDVSEMTTEQQIEWLVDGRVDALLMMPSLSIPGAVFEPICEEKLVAVVSSQSSFASQNLFDLETLRHQPVLASRLEDCRFHVPFLHNLLAPFGIVPKIVEVPQSCVLQFAYAAAGEGIAVATESMLQCSFPGVVGLHFKQELPKVTLGITFMKANESAALRIFRDVLRTSLEDLRRETQSLRLVSQSASPAMPMGKVPSFEEHREKSS